MRKANRFDEGFRQKTSRKIKNLKNLLTKQTASAKLNKLTARAESDTDLENCIEQEKVRRRTKSQTIPREPERAKKQESIDGRDSAVEGFELKSLILAQDERWRRA